MDSSLAPGYQGRRSAVASRQTGDHCTAIELMTGALPASRELSTGSMLGAGQVRIVGVGDCKARLVRPHRAGRVQGSDVLATQQARVHAAG